MTDSEVTPSVYNARITALRFFFGMTCDREDMKKYMQFRTEPRKLPIVLSIEEVSVVLAAAPGPGMKYRAALGIGYGAGLRASEVTNLKVRDIDSDRMLIHVERGRRLGARVGMTSVLHTWGSAMTHHPHIHMIVPGGGLSQDGTKWVACKPGFFLHVRVLSRLFRRLFLDGLRGLHQAGQLTFYGNLVELPVRRSVHGTQIDQLPLLPALRTRSRPGAIGLLGRLLAQALDDIADLAP